MRGNEIRRRKYGDAAYEWPPGRTPTELVEKRAIELDNMIATMEAPSPSECYDNEEDDLEQKKEKDRSDSRLHWLEQPSLLTPSPSNFGSIPNPALSRYQSSLSTPEKVVLEAKSRKKRRPCSIQEQRQHQKRPKIPAGADEQFPLSGFNNSLKGVGTRGEKRRRDNMEGDHHKRGRMGEGRLRRSARLRRYYKDDCTNYKGWAAF